MSRYSLRIRLDFLSDWHVGDGLGAYGSLDARVRRDAQGCPMVPGSTLRAMLRDGAEQLARGLDGGDADGPWSAFAVALFGAQPAAKGEDAIPSRLAVENARLHPSLRAARALRPAMVLLKPGVEIDPVTGAAKEKHFRIEEVARRGSVLYAEAEIDCPEPRVAELALAFLSAAAVLVPRLGGKRRRGLGRVDIAVEDGVGKRVSPSDFADLIENAVPPSLPPLAFAGIDLAPLGAGVTDTFDEYDLDIVLTAPTLIAAQVQGNVVSCDDVLPGTVLLAALAGRLSALDAAAFQSAVTAGDLRILPGYPMLDGIRTLPVPAVWYGPKNGEGAPVNALHDELLGGYRRLSSPFFAGTDKPSALVKSVPRSVFTHNSVDDDRQRPDANAGGGVYVYEALTPGARFGAQLRVRGPFARILAGSLKDISGPVRLGRAINAGYGAATLDMRPAQREPVVYVSDAQLTIYFESDTILRSEGGGFATDAGTVLRAIGAPPDTTEIAHANLSATRIGGWRRAWGAAAPDAVAVRAGSVIALTSRPFALDRVRMLEREGVGERRAEGFGVVRIDPPFLAAAAPLSFPLARAPDSVADGSVDPPEGSDAEFARILSHAATREWIARAAELFLQRAAPDEIAGHLGFRAREIRSGEKPPMSQLGTLRALWAQVERDCDVFADRLDALSANRRRRDKWPDGALETLARMARDPARLWQALSEAANEKPPTPVGITASDLRLTLRSDLFETVLHAAIRRRRREEESLAKKPVAEAEV